MQRQPIALFAGPIVVAAAFFASSAAAEERDELPFFVLPPAVEKIPDYWLPPLPALQPGELEDLPSRVDNSQRPSFPPIRAQRFGSCAQEASVGTIFSYEINSQSQVEQTDDTEPFPSHFTWNFVNRASNSGSEIIHGWEVGRLIGVPSGNYFSNDEHGIGQWLDGYDGYYNALTNRVTGYRFNYVATPEDLLEIKRWLHNRGDPGSDTGGLWAIDVRPRGIRSERIAEEEHEAGSLLWVEYGKEQWGHVITCVGYDDNVGFDVNGDGRITNDVDLDGDGEITLRDWERGALIAANSWGKRWGNEGRVYILYRCIPDPDWERALWFGRVEVAKYQPRMTLRLRLTFADRAALRLTAGIANDPTAEQSDTEIRPVIANGIKEFGDVFGHVPMRGPDDDRPIELAVDLSELITEDLTGDDMRVFLHLDRAGNSDAEGEVTDAVLLVYGENGEVTEYPVVSERSPFGEQPLDASTVIRRAGE